MIIPADTVRQTEHGYIRCQRSFFHLHFITIHDVRKIQTKQDEQIRKKNPHQHDQIGRNILQENSRSETGKERNVPVQLKYP